MAGTLWRGAALASLLGMAGWPAAALEPAELLARLGPGTIAAISDGEFLGQTYATGLLAPAGQRDVLTVISTKGGKLVRGEIEVSNSVTAAPEIMQLSSDGRTAFVVERLGQRPPGGEIVRDLPSGRRQVAVDLSGTTPRLADTITVGAFPEALSVSPDGSEVAVVSNTPEASLVQIVAYEGGFGTPAGFDLAALGLTGTAPTPRGGVTASNVHWHPSGRFIAVNINTQDRVAFFEVTRSEGVPALRAWGGPVTVGRDPFVGRFTPDGRHYLTSNWGRNFAATDLEGRLPTTPSTISVVRLAAPDAGEGGRHELLPGAVTDLSAEGLAVSPDGRLVATVNMRGTAFPPASARFEHQATVTLLSFDPASGTIAKLADYPFEGVLPEGGSFDASGGHFLATVFHGHAGREAGAGIEVFRVLRGEPPSLERLGRIPLPHGVHHVDVAR